VCSVYGTKPQVLYIKFYKYHIDPADTENLCINSSTASIIMTVCCSLCHQSLMKCVSYSSVR